MIWSVLYDLAFDNNLFEGYSLGENSVQ